MSKMKVNRIENTASTDGGIDIDSNGKIGVGTASPANKLHVSDTSGSAQIRITGSSGSSNIYADSNIYFQPNGSTAVTLASSGNVGVGLTSPASKLHVKGGSLTVEHGSPSTGTGQLNINSESNSQVTFSYDDQGHISFGTATTPATQAGFSEKMRIDSSGRLLVGSSTVQAHANMDDLQVGDGSGNRGITISSGTSNYGTLAFGDSTDASGVDRYAGAIEYYHSNNSMAFLTSSTSRMTLDSSGNFGIGESSPSAKLDVYLGDNVAGTIARFGGYNDGRSLVISNSGIGNLIDINHQGGGGKISVSTGSTERLRVDSSGRLLVGTSNTYDGEASNLVVASSGHTGITVASTGSNQRTNLYFADGTSGSDAYAGGFTYNHNNNSLLTRTAGLDRMTINSSGVVFFPAVYNATTAAAANLVVHSTGELNRSTSSAKYKTDVETLQDSYADAILNCRPVWYRSVCEIDNPKNSWWGFIAEEVAAIDPRLVHWKTTEVTYDEKGSTVKTPCDPEPEGVAYDRFVPHLLNLIKRQQTAIETLETEVAALKAGN